MRDIKNSCGTQKIVAEYFLPTLTAIRLWLLEVNFNKYYIDTGEITGEFQRAVKIGYLERGVRDRFKRIKDQAKVEVLVTVYLEGERPGGQVFYPSMSWEEFDKP